MSIVNDRMQAAKPVERPDTKKSLAAQVNNDKDLGVENKKEEPSFFSSFFPAGARNTAPKKKGVSVMESPAPVIRPQAALSDRESMETEVIKLLIHSYFNIVKREMIDMVPKSITYTLVQQAKDNLQRVLLEQLYKPDVLENLMRESEDVVVRRRELVGL